RSKAWPSACRVRNGSLIDAGRRSVTDDATPIPAGLEEGGPVSEVRTETLAGQPDDTPQRAPRAKVVVHRLDGGLEEGESDARTISARSEEHTSELQSLAYLVCRLLLEKKN